MAKNGNKRDSIVVHAEMLDDGTLELRICEDPDTVQVSNSVVVRPDPVGALSDARVGRAFLQLCGVPLMSRRRARV